MPPRPVALVVLDGLGLAPPGPGNAVAQAATPVLDRLLATCPTSRLRTDGETVGLLPGQMGNSNVGHLTIGAGRVIDQDLVRIARAAASGELARRMAAHGLDTAPRLHVLGLLSDGGVHSHIDHWNAVLAARGAGVTWLHLFLDGRDVPPGTAPAFLERLRPAGARVATVMGRFYAMDRDRRWPRTEAAYRAIVHGEGERAASPQAAVAAAYARGESDEFVRPTVIGDYPGAQSGDRFLTVNFRADRMRQLTRALADPAFDAFATAGAFDVVTMTEYDRDFPLPTLFGPEAVTDTLGDVIAEAGLRQFRVAETEKYAHVTYFLSGGREAPVPGEERRLVPSPKVRTYDEAPAMSAAGVAAEAAAAVRSGRHDVLIVNFANPDMVGHTGNLAAAVAAVEEVDRRLGELLAAIEAAGGVALVIADHGNVECMIHPDGGPHTAHTTNPVPAILFDPAGHLGPVRLADGTLADVAPTILDVLGIPKPAAMTGASLIRPGAAEPGDSETDR
jgi:2,3-bisphosphoglycerate-independent phosphoglycerate mutase